MNRRALSRLASPPADTPAPNPFAPAPLSIQAGLEPHTVSLDRVSAGHLLRRTHFGVNPTLRDTYAGKVAADAATELVQAAIDVSLPDPPDWVDATPPGRDAPREEQQAYQQLNQERLRAWVANWLTRMTRYGLREKMTLFWHNHFVTEVDAYRGEAPVAYRYVTTLRTHALGNFKDLVHAVGLDPAMLLYLNGQQNQAAAPNENYARELLELFTMGQFDANGQQNYTQHDIEEIARALTGWTFDRRDLSVAFVPGRHDGGEKTFFGRTGAWGYDDVVEILFEERADEIASFVCGKLYREFIYAAPDAAMVAALAEVFVSGGFELAPVVEALLGSAHFFDEQVIGAHIKSPVEMLVAFTLELDVAPSEDVFLLLNRAAEPLQQRLLDPPNVAGWPGHHAWLNTTTFVSRWNLIDNILRGLERTDRLNLVALAEQLHDAADPDAVFTLPLALAEHLLPVPLDLLDVPVSEEPFAGDLINNPIPDAVLNGPAYALNLAKLFLAGTPWYEWDLQNNGAARLISTYLQALKLLPEFQLA